MNCTMMHESKNIKKFLLQESGESLIKLKAYKQEMYDVWER